MRLEKTGTMPPELGRRGAARLTHPLRPLHTVDGAISYCSAIALQLSPDAIAAATRCLRSFEYSLAMHAGPLSSMQLESQTA
jgi:hypothetical protein